MFKWWYDIINVSSLRKKWDMIYIHSFAFIWKRKKYQHFRRREKRERRKSAFKQTSNEKLIPFRVTCFPRRRQFWAILFRLPTWKEIFFLNEIWFHKFEVLLNTRIINFLSNLSFEALQVFIIKCQNCKVLIRNSHFIHTHK